MAVKFTNNAKTTLASSITDVATTATVTDGSVFPTLGAGEYFYCTFDDTTNNEIVKVTARSGNTLTIVRGVDNTTARAFSSGDAAELRATAGLLTDIQENIAAKSANQTVYNTTTASSATSYDIGIDPSVEANAMVFLNGVMQHHDTFSFSGSTLTFDTAPSDGMALEVIVDNLINLQSSNLTVDTFTAADVGGNPQTDFTLSDSPAAETNLIVFVDGVFQDQDAYTISSNVLTMTDGVVADRVVTVYVINPVNIGTPSDGTVTSAKLSGNITMPANLTVTGDVAFDSPTFVVDNANSRVGIGTAAPTTLLDIVGDVKMSADLTVDTNTLVVDSTNNRVGIGVTNPATTLGINGATQILAGNALYFQNSAADANGTISGSGGAGENTLSFNSGAMVLNAAGNVGIGGSPLDALHIQSEVTTDYRGNLLLSDTTAIAAGVGGQITFGGKFSGSTLTEWAAIQGTKDNATSGEYGGSLELKTRAHNGSLSTKMFVSSSGNVGIGTSSPTYNLSVENSSGNVYIQAKRASQSQGQVALELSGGTSGTNWVMYQPISSNDLRIFGNSGDRMTITSSGNVGINWGAPTARLGIIQSGSSTPGMNITDGSSSDFQVFAGYSSGLCRIGPSAGNLAFSTSNAERVRISGTDLLVGWTGGTYNDPGYNNTDGISLRGSTHSSTIIISKDDTIGTYSYYSYRRGNGSNGNHMLFQHGNTVGSIRSTYNGSTSYNTSSDYRLKENIEYEFNALERVTQLKPVRFNFIADEADTTVDGFLAHEVQDVVPEAITGVKDEMQEEEYEVTPAELDEDGNVITEAVMGTREVPVYQGIDQSKLVPLLTKAIQELTAKLEAAEARITELENN